MSQFVKNYKMARNLDFGKGSTARIRVFGQDIEFHIGNARQFMAAAMLTKRLCKTAAKANRQLQRVKELSEEIAELNNISEG